MNRKSLVILILALVVLAAVSFAYLKRGDGSSNVSTASEAEAVVYHCPMHPTVQSHEPGTCPICGMRLVPRPESSTADANSGESGLSSDALAAVSLSPEQRITANVRTVRVEPMTETGDLVTTGRVTFDERRTAQVTAYAAGRIERLAVSFTGDTVRRGQAVATIYSPDLYATQQEYLLALSNRERMQNAGFAGARSAADDLVDSTRRRLLLSGMSESQIRQLERDGKPVYATTVISPVSGVVTSKLVVPQQYVVLGQPLFEVVDLSQVWVDADVYEQQLPAVRLGQSVEITTAAIPDRALSGVVSFIQPTLAGQSRTARVRIDLPNTGLLLKPDMYVSVRLIGVAAEEHIMVPASAVVDRGQSRYVWVELVPGRYEPRTVVTGARHGEQVVVLSGLEQGDSVVVEGAFLLDSEAQLRSVSAPGDHQGH